MIKIRHNSGFLRTILIIIIAFIILSYYGFDFQSAVNSQQTQKNYSYVQGIWNNLWTNTLKKPITYFWNNIFINLFWDSFIDNMQRIKNGEVNDFGQFAPTL